MIGDEAEFWADKLHLKKNERALFLLLATSRMVTMPEMVDAITAYREDGGPGQPELVVRSTITRLRQKIDRRFRITGEFFYYLQPLPMNVPAEPEEV